MKKILTQFIILVALSAYMSKGYAQCSDAGVCSVGGHLMEKENRSLFNISVSYKYGYSGKDDGVKYNSFQVGALYNVLEKTSLQFSIPYNMQSGQLGNVSGIGDLLVSINQNLYSDENSGINASFGVKLVTGDDNKDNLPMAYQSGMGSNDLIFALSYFYYKISFDAGYQLAGKRNNNLLKLKRGNDLLVRASYNLNFDKVIIVPQLLFIKRLEKSSIVNLLSMAPTESYIDVDKSDQTQLNLLTNFQFKINEYFMLFADFAVPFINREVNVDGLTRAFSASAGIMISIK